MQNRISVIDGDQDRPYDDRVEKPPPQHRRLEGHPQPVSHTETNPDPRRLVSASLERLVARGDAPESSWNFTVPSQIRRMIWNDAARRLSATLG